MNNSMSMRRFVPSKQLFHNDGNRTSDDDDDSDTKLPLKNPGRQTPKSSSKASTPKASSSSRPAPASPQFSSGKNGGKEDEFWEMQRPGMFDSPLKKKPRKAPQQKYSGVGVIPFTTDNDETKVLLYEPLDENNSKRGFLVDFGGPIDGSGDVFEAASKILTRETNCGLFDTNGELRKCPSVTNDDKGGYVILFFKVKYQDPKNFEAMSERKRMYRWVPVSAILERNESVLKCPLHERMTNAKNFYNLLGTLIA